MMDQTPIRYEIQLGVSIFNRVVVAYSKEEMLVDEDAIIVTEEDPKMINKKEIAAVLKRVCPTDQSHKYIKRHGYYYCARCGKR